MTAPVAGMGNWLATFTRQADIVLSDFDPTAMHQYLHHAGGQVAERCKSGGIPATDVFTNAHVPALFRPAPLGAKPEDPLTPADELVKTLQKPNGRVAVANALAVVRFELGKVFGKGANPFDKLKGNLDTALIDRKCDPKVL